MTASTPPELDGVTHRFVELPGLRMHVAEAGDGEPLLLLHGFPQHWWGWSKVLPALAEHYRVIAPDLRGAGWTDAPRTGYGADQLVADVVALLDVLELDRVRVIGHDWGALVGFLLCLHHPERVERFVSLAIPHPFVRFQPRLLAAFPRLWFQYAIATPVLGPALLRRGRQPLAHHLLDNYTSDPAAFSPGDRELFVGQYRERDRARAGSALYRNFIVPIFGRVLAGRYRSMRLSTPTLIVFGGDDPNMSAALLDGHQSYADELVVEELPGASHFLVDEQPDAVVARVLRFLA
jgi:pimeloyl-ACP methyl ester carboxylesterase